MGGHVLMKVYYKKMSNLEKSEVVRWIILMVGFIALLLILGYMFTQAWFR
jgi:Mg2+ and Co2+ transporter CorA